jgi:Aldo/keto reductases, related to diketogulonate reductase
MEQKLSRRRTIQLLGYAGLGMLLPVPVHAFINQEANMLTRPIPSSKEQLPVIGLGSWLQFDVGTSASEREPLKEVLQQMLDKGGKLIDSSPMYGRSEEVIGELTAASGHASRFFYATKVWTSGEQAGIQQMQQSMLRMKRSTLDLMQVHNLEDWKTHLKTMNKWKAEGRLRYTGVTHYTVSAHAQLEEIVRSKVVDFVQFNYSIRVRHAEKSLLKACMDTGVAVIINEPFEKGDLFRLPKGKTLPAWAADYDIKSWAQFFLKYIISHPAVNCAIPGTSNPKHAADNMMAGYGKLPDEKGRKKMVEFIESI